MKKEPILVPIHRRTLSQTDDIEDEKAEEYGISAPLSAREGN